MKVFKQRNDVCCEHYELILGVTFAKKLKMHFLSPLTEDVNGTSRGRSATL